MFKKFTNDDERIETIGMKKINDDYIIRLGAAKGFYFKENNYHTHCVYIRESVWNNIRNRIQEKLNLLQVV